jgi:ABC-type Fe3+/spermidine/putrescine transport system ATPase subunit
VSESTTHVIALRHVSKDHGAVRVLVDCDLVLREGEHMALLGPSGGGKSTILRLLAGLEAPTRGTVIMDGVLASTPERICAPPHRRRLAMVFQDLGLWPALTACENVIFGLDAQRLSRRDRQLRAATALDLCGVAALASRLPGTLSGGEQQRIALARAVAAEPVFLLLDEPFAGVDLATKADLLRDLKPLLTERRMTTCLVTHDPTEAFALCTHGALLEHGRVAVHGPWTEILDAPRFELLRHFKAAYRTASE